MAAPKRSSLGGPGVRGKARRDTWRWRTSDATRERILTAACELFTERGYGNVKLAEVLARAGASTGSFYHHFTAKQDLFTDLWQGYRTTQDRVRAEAENVARRAGVDDPVALWAAGTRGVLEDTWRRRELAGIFAAGEVPGQGAVVRRDDCRVADDTGPLPHRPGGAEGELYASCLRGLVQTGAQAVIGARDGEEARRLIDATVGYCLQIMVHRPGRAGCGPDRIPRKARHAHS